MALTDSLRPYTPRNFPLLGNEPRFFTTELANISAAFTSFKQVMAQLEANTGVGSTASRRVSWPSANFTSSTNATAAACKGNFMMLEKSITVDRIYAVFNATSGHVYGAFIANITGSGNAPTISSTLATATRVTAGASGLQTLEFVFATPVTLNAGSTYGFCVVDTNLATTTTALPIVGALTSAYTNLPQDVGLMIKTWNITGSVAQFGSWATLSDSPSSLAVTGVGSGCLAIGLRWYDLG